MNENLMAFQECAEKLKQPKTLEEAIARIAILEARIFQLESARYCAPIYPAPQYPAAPYYHPAYPCIVYC